MHSLAASDAADIADRIGSKFAGEVVRAVEAAGGGLTDALFVAEAGLGQIIATYARANNWSAERIADVLLPMFVESVRGRIQLAELEAKVIRLPVAGRA